VPGGVTRKERAKKASARLNAFASMKYKEGKNERRENEEISEPGACTEGFRLKSVSRRKIEKQKFWERSTSRNTRKKESTPLERKNCGKGRDRKVWAKAKRGQDKIKLGG